MFRRFFCCLFGQNKYTFMMIIIMDSTIFYPQFIILSCRDTVIESARKLRASVDVHILLDKWIYPHNNLNAFLWGASLTYTGAIILAIYSAQFQTWFTWFEHTHTHRQTATHLNIHNYWITFTIEQRLTRIIQVLQEESIHVFIEMWLKYFAIT